MRIHTLFITLAATLFATAASSPVPETGSAVVERDIAKRDFGPITIYTPPANYTNERTLYARSLMLKDGTILATWENYDWSGQPWFPIYESKDHGFTWKELSRVYDTQNGWGLRYQPQLYLLENDLGGFKAGTILLSGNSIPHDLSQTQIDLYASTDNGKTWTFVSHIAHGGKAVPNNGETPVWEPFLLEYNNQLIVFYSDQRDPKYGQKLVYQASGDLRNWGPVVDVETNPVYGARPGMPVVSKIAKNKYFLTYENWNPEVPEASFAVYYKIASDPTKFGKTKGQPLTDTTGHTPFGSPFNVFTPVGGKKGTIVVNANSDSDFFLNHDQGKGEWTRLSTQESAAYTRSLAVGFNPKDILIVSGGSLGNGPNNKVTVSARDVNGCSTCS